jgi:glycogen synthase
MVKTMHLASLAVSLLATPVLLSARRYCTVTTVFTFHNFLHWYLQYQYILLNWSASYCAQHVQLVLVYLYHFKCWVLLITDIDCWFVHYTTSTSLSV